MTVNKKAFFIFSAIVASIIALILSLFFIPPLILSVVSLVLTAASVLTLNYTLSIVLRREKVSKKPAFAVIFSIITFFATLFVVVFNARDDEALIIIALANLVGMIINCLTTVYYFNRKEGKD